VALRQPLNVLCHVVVGKKVESEAFGARLVELSGRGGVLLTPRRLRALSNLKLELRPLGRDPVVLYAKVVLVSSDGSIGVRFTSLPAEVEAWLHELVEAGHEEGGA
jgi:hypothetical protein